MSQYRAYPAYKDSGVEWIGLVPEHWEVKPICRVTSVNDDVLPDSTTDDTPIRYVDISSVGYMEGIKQASDMCFADAPSRARRKASSGDVIISTVRTYLKAVAAVTDEYADCVFSTGFAVLRARHLDRSFLKWMVLNELLIQAIEAHSEGLSYPAINASALVKLKSVIPPPEEQASIAATLDRETARIDALIEKKTRFIELLKEKRQALITHAITKGLDPNAKMKDSGIEWIGQVPEHWKVARVKRLASLRNERRNDVSTDTIYIGLEDVEAGSGQYKPTNGSSRQSEDSTVGIFYEGDVLYGKLRPYLRKAIISEMAGCCSTEFLVLRAEKTEPRWLQEWLLTPDVTHQIVSGCEGAKMPRADWGHIGSIEVVYPDQPEQAKILTSLDRETARIDALISKTEQSITLLKERRAAFITAAVTGQIDLRGKQ
ncbi:TPA: restriction endonuclease subunit S [Enterobacter kobei]|nr:restriction endonuclease subunit S [Klebsiella pneumoniae]HDT5923790.1 restriction endonuclease subunit S [Klebsiella pneumoniae subsp. pneumoniae]HDU4055246.1 restriction endonuclease subunit S [Klebsiella pneumoniae subsp. pneumoniae]HDV9093493.1 restriction endonuclease subunit S [Enterobacter kobei]